MVDYSREDVAWEKLRKKVQERHNPPRKRNRLILPILLLALLVGVLGCGYGFYAAAQRVQPLVLPETVTVSSLTVAEHVVPEAADFVQGLEGTGISVAFSEGYDSSKLGTQEVSLVFSQGEKSCTLSTQLYRFHLEQTLTVMLGEEDQVDVRDFVPDETVEAEIITNVTPGECGRYTLQLRCEGREYSVQCIVAEDIPPQGTGVTVTVEASQIPEASVFVRDIVDHTQVTVTYKEQPKLVQVGEQPVVVILTDIFGNSTEVNAVANVVPAENGPQFTGLTQLYVETGGSVSYKNGVTATDAQDGKLTFTVDTGSFDNRTPGSYTVYYSAVDSDGNQLIMPRTVIVENHITQLVRETAQAILAEIIKPGMTQDEKIDAVYRRVRFYVYYSGNSDKSSLENAAYEGFTKGSGDCYTYYAMVRVMLDLLEIPNLEVARVGGTSNHWWNLVQFEDGKYYHVDATPHQIVLIDHNKMTESDIERYTNNPQVMKRRPNYYVYDHTLPEYQDIEIAQ